MSQTEPLPWEQLAGALFDEMIVPLALAKRESEAQAYFPLRGEDHAETYFVEPSLRTMEASDFQPHRGDAEGLVDAVTALWAAQGETGLVELAARMTEIAALLAEESTQGDGRADVLCYTLF